MELAIGNLIVSLYQHSVVPIYVYICYRFFFNIAFLYIAYDYAHGSSAFLTMASAIPALVRKRN